MTDTIQVTYDDQGHARALSVPRKIGGEAEMGLAGAAAPRTAREAATEFLKAQAGLLQVPTEATQRLDFRAGIAPTNESGALRFETEKQLMDTTVVSFNQTMFGLPIFRAGVSVTVQTPDNQVRAASSTLHYDVEADAPGASLAGAGLTAAVSGGYDDLARRSIPAAKDMRINRTRMIVYQYDAKKRLHSPHEDGEGGFHVRAPELPLPPVPKSIKDGKHYIVVEVLFTLPLPGFGPLNWRAFIEPETGAVLRLRALIDGATGLVFDRDPITKTGNLANLPNASAATLDVLRDTATLLDLNGPVAGQQALEGSFVRLAEYSLPTIPPPTRTNPFNFDYSSRTNDFAAANAYYHCDRFFRMVRDTGFSIASYFDGTAFPVLVDHRGQGNVLNAQCPGNSMGNGIGAVQFALADTSNVGNPLGIAADWRVVLHELGGHGILWDHVNSPNFGFAHSAGDGIAAILNDPDTHAPDRFVTFPWVNIGRRHDRPVNGWGWGGANDVGGYSSEQILATCHFRIYRSLGGDSTYQPSRVFAARSTVYLILRAVGQLTPATNPGSPLLWEQQLETADAGVWTSTTPAETHAGGAYHKVIRWAFEKQGLFRAVGDPVTAEGRAPAVDVYIDDGRHGEYQYQPVHWNCGEIINRLAPGTGGWTHEEPEVGQINYAYVRIKNRGSQVATNVVVKAFHCLPGVGLEFPTDWIPMTTPQLAAPNIAANDSVGVVVGPFQWMPSQVGHECMFFSVSAQGDPGNIDGHVVGPIPEWRLVPHDNNLGQRNVHPVDNNLNVKAWEKLPFWARNHKKVPVKASVQVHVPAWLAKLGWKFDVPALSKERAVVKPGEKRKATVAMTAGRPFTAAEFEKQRDRDIVVTVLYDGAPAGGMTYRLTAPKRG